MEIPVRQRQYQFHKGPQGYDLRLIDDVTVRVPGPHEVLVRVMASSLNRRDLLIHRGLYPIGDRDAVVPLSDGAGEVVAIGSSVTRVRSGDRVVASFFQAWLDGRPVASTGASALGGALDGMLTEYITLHETGVLQCPSHLSFEEAATLPCAALTAWNGLFTCGGLRRGDYALLQGTGGVSIFGLQFAALAGATVLLTSSSDGKLARARGLGATHLINYRTTPDWDQAALEATAGIGVHHVLEVGGIGTLQRSLAALAHGRTQHPRLGDLRRISRRFRADEHLHRAACIAAGDRPRVRLYGGTGGVRAHGSRRSFRQGRHPARMTEPTRNGLSPGARPVAKRGPPDLRLRRRTPSPSD